jgi:TPR repeat protein
MTLLSHLRRCMVTVLGRPGAKLAFATELSDQGAHQVAFRLFLKTAKAGLPAASYWVGRAYLLGHGVPCCVAAALHWLTRAAEAGEVVAQSLLAHLALQGMSETKSAGLFDTGSGRVKDAPDFDRALKWASLAAAGGSVEAKVTLGFILTTGPERLRDQEQGEDLYRQAAGTGNVQGQLGWALVLLRSNPPAVTEARELLEAAAGADLPTAHYMLGVIAESGTIGAPDYAAAANHYRAAAELGHHSAELHYGMALLTGRGVTQDGFNGESWLRRAALAGESQAAAIVGDLYARTDPLPPNYFEAAIWFRRAAEAGHSGAARALGQLHLRGVGAARDPLAAAAWFRQSVAHGDAEAMVDLAQMALKRQVSTAGCEATVVWFLQQTVAGDLTAAFNLGVCLAEGVGIQRDDSLALALFRHAAKSMPIAQYWCGRMLAEGRGSTLDLPAARVWFLQAAEQHNADAEVAAAEMLINGRGGPSDRSMALALFKRAAAIGHPGALLALEVLRRSVPINA